MNYIQMILTNIKETAIKKGLSNVEVLINPLTVFQIRIMFWVVVVIVV